MSFKDEIKNRVSKKYEEEDNYAKALQKATKAESSKKTKISTVKAKTTKTTTPKTTSYGFNSPMDNDMGAAIPDANTYYLKKQAQKKASAGIATTTNQIVNNINNFKNNGTVINRNDSAITYAQKKSYEPVTKDTPKDAKTVTAKTSDGKKKFVEGKTQAQKDFEYANNSSFLGIGKNKKSYALQALKTAGDRTGSNMVSLGSMFGDVASEVSRELRASGAFDNIQNSVSYQSNIIPSTEQNKKAQSEYQKLKNYWANRAEQSQAELQRMTNNDKAKQKIAEFVQMVPDMAAIALTSMANPVAGAEVAGETLLKKSAEKTATGFIKNVITKNASNPAFWSSMIIQTGDAYQEAVDRGAEPLEALVSGLTVGTLNAEIETLGGIGATDDLVKIATKGQLAKRIAKNAFEEGMEEVNQGITQETVYQAMGISQPKLATNDIERFLDRNMPGQAAYANLEAYDQNQSPAIIDPSRMTQEFIGGALGGAVFSTPENLINYKANKNTKTTPQQIPYNFGTQKVAKASPISQAEAQLENLKNETQQANYPTAQSLNKDLTSMNEEDLNALAENALNTLETNKDSETVKAQNNLLSEIQTELNNRANQPKNIPLNNQIEQNLKNGQSIKQALSNVENKPQSIPYNLNTKEGRIAAKITDEKTEAQVEALSKVFGRNIRFSTELSDDIHGSHDLKTGDIVLNANAIKDGNAINVILGHELTHGLEKTKSYSKMSDLIESYIDSQDGDSFKERVERLKPAYQKEIEEMTDEEAYNYLKQEYVAEFAGNYVFNNEDFINRIAREDRSMFQRIKEWISDTISKLTTDNDAYKMLVNARRLYDKAARESLNAEATNTEKFSKVADVKASTAEEEKLFSGLEDVTQPKSKLDTKVDKIKAQIDSIDERHEKLKTRFDALLEKGYDENEKQLDEMWDRMEKLEAQKDKLSKELVRAEYKAKKNMLATHNISPKDLLKALDLGGLAGPSIAITTDSAPHTSFASISLVFNKDTVDPKKDSRNKLYGRDAWTPTFPEVEARANKEKISEISDKLGKLSEKTPDFAREQLNEFVDKLQDMDNNAYGRLENIDYDLNNKLDIAMKEAFLADIGEETVPMLKGDKVIPKDPKIAEGFTSMKSFLEKNMGVKDLGGDPNEAIEKYWREQKDNIKLAFMFYYPRTKEHQNADNEEMLGNLEPKKKLFADYYKFVYGYDTASVDSKYEDDVESTRELVNKKVNDTEYEKWKDKLFEGVAKQWIRNTKSEYTQTGKKRSWDSLHDELTLENVVKTMANKQKQGTGGGKSNRTNLFGATAERYNSLEQAKMNKGRIRSSYDNDMARHEFVTRYKKLVNSMTSSWDVGPQTISDYLLKSVTKYKSKEAIGRYLRKEIGASSNYNPELLDEFINLVDDIREMPVLYFESKVYRGVGFDEVKAALVPSDVNPEITRRLKEHDIEVISYTDEKDRRAKLRSLDNLKFKKEGVQLEEDGLNEKLTKAAETKKNFTGKGKVEGARELIAVHNIQPSELMKSFKLGGLPMPSIAIIKAMQGHDMFGTISLVFDKNSIDPKADSRNRVYGADAYTPTFPQVEPKLSESKSEEIYRRANKGGSMPFFNPSMLHHGNLKDIVKGVGGEQENLVKHFENDYGLKQMFLHETGDEPVSAIKKIDEKTIDDSTKEKYEWFLNNKPDILEKNKEGKLTEQELNEAYRDYLIESRGMSHEKAENASSLAKVFKLRMMLNSIERYKENGGIERNEVVDEQAMKNAIDSKVNSEEYKRWLNELFDGIIEKQGIWNGKELFTPSGNRRSFEQTHYELNLENIVQAMNNEPLQGQGFGGMNIFGSSAEKFNSIDEVKARSGQLKHIPEEEYNNMRAEFTERLSKITDEMSKGKSFSAKTDANDVLLEALTKFKTKSAMVNYIKKQTKGWANYNSEMIDDFLEIVEDVRQMPTGYFEAKPARAVGFGEVKAALVPNDVNPKLVKMLQDYGTEVLYYEPGNAADRAAKLNSLDALKFRKAEDGPREYTEAEKATNEKLERAAALPMNKFKKKPQTIPYNKKDTFNDTEDTYEDTLDTPEDTSTISNIEEKTTTPEEATANVPETRKAEAYNRRSVKNFRNSLLKDLHITRFASSKAMKQYTDEIVSKIKTNTLTANDKDRLFMNIIAEGEVLNQEKADKYSDIVTELKGRSLYVSDQTAKNITDYKQWKHDSKLKLSPKGGSHIDDVYASLQAKYPEVFPEVNTQEEMLENLNEAYNDATDVYTPLTQMNESQLDGAMEAYRETFDKAIDELEREVNIAKRYNTFRANKTTQEVFNDYSQLNRLKHNLDKVKNDVLLTDEDRADLNLLLKGSITEERLRERNENADNILKVYEAQKPVEELKASLKKVGEETHKEYRKIAADALKKSDFWKEKKRGIQFVTDTAERNMEDLAGYEDAKAINATYFTPIHENEARSTRMKNDYREEIRSLNVSEKNEYNLSNLSRVYAPEIQTLIAEQNGKDLVVSESALVQMYGEGLLDKTQLAELGADIDKIENATATMRNMYEQMLDEANQVLITHGYEPIAHRQNYFPHFTADRADSALGKIGEALGFKVQKDELNTDIAGLTHTFKPGKKWFGNALQRNGKQTDYDALDGFDRYIEGIGDIIFHTQDIQKLRALESELRYKYSEEGRQKRLKEIDNDITLSEVEKEAERQAVYEAGMKKHGTLAQWIRRYTDTLAGKKSMSDREMEFQAGRKTYGIVKSLESRVAANMVALNPGSWLTNFIPLVQGSEVKNSNIIKGMAGAAQSFFTDDGFKDRSAFLTNRSGSDTLTSSTVEKIADKLTQPMEWIDTFTSQSLVRAKYLQGIEEGKTEWEAMQEADRFAANVIADRSKGSLPLIFESKNPVTKILTMYQVEVNNQWNHLFKDIPRTEGNVQKVAFAYAKFAIGAYLFNDVFEKLVGRRPALDPISWLNDFTGDITGKQLPNFIDAIAELLQPDDDDEDKKERFLELFNAEVGTGGTAVTNLGKNVAEDLTFVGGLLGGGRVPIQSALPDIGTIATNIANIATGDANTKKALSNIGKELANPLTYLAPPVGGGQAKKVIQSTKDIAQGGNYSINSNGEKELHYAVDNSYENWIKGLLFGEYAMDGGKEYLASGYKRLNSKGTAAYDAIRGDGISNSEAEKTIRGIVGAGNKADKINALKQSNLTTKQKKQVAEILDLTSLNSKAVNYSDNNPVETTRSSGTTGATKEYKFQTKVDNLVATGMSSTQAKKVTDATLYYDNKYAQAIALAGTGNYTDAACEALGIPKYVYQDKKGKEKIQLAIDNDITPRGYMNRFNGANANNDSSVNQAEAKAYLDTQNMTKAEKRLWWKLLTGGADKNNPY